MIPRWDMTERINTSDDCPLHTDSPSVTIRCGSTELVKLSVKELSYCSSPGCLHFKIICGPEKWEDLYNKLGLGISPVINPTNLQRVIMRLFRMSIVSAVHIEILADREKRQENKIT